MFLADVIADAGWIGWVNLVVVRVVPLEETVLANSGISVPHRSSHLLDLAQAAIANRREATFA